MADGWRRSAEISACGAYRTRLERARARPGTLVVVMLNPSTADGLVDDPTIRRCLGFAAREGLGTLVVVNLFTARTPHPRELCGMLDPVGPQADAALARAIAETGRRGIVMGAWGARPSAANPRLADLRLARIRRVFELTVTADVDLVCLGTTADGSPRHPLYVPGDAPFVPLPAH